MSSTSQKIRVADVLLKLSETSNRDAREIAEGIVALDGSVEQRTEAVGVLLTKLLQANDRDVGDLAEAIVRVGGIAEQREDGAGALLDRLPEAYAPDVQHLTEAVGRLEGTVEQRTEATTALLATLPGGPDSDLGTIAEIMATLGTVDPQVQFARASVSRRDPHPGDHCCGHSAPVVVGRLAFPVTPHGACLVRRKTTDPPLMTLGPAC